MRFAVDDGGLTSAAVLLTFLVSACVIDVRERRIPNAVVVAMLTAGIIASCARDPLLEGLWKALAGAALGLALWMPAWVFRMMGAGDVKLFAASGAWLGPLGVVNATLAAAALGGVLALGWMLMRRGGTRTAAAVLTTVSAPRMLLDRRGVRTAGRELVPYSLAIAGGVLVQLIFPWLVLGP